MWLDAKHSDTGSGKIVFSGFRAEYRSVGMA
jgi:hypothetical protein